MISFLGAHLTNDPTFKLPSKVKEKISSSGVSSEESDPDISDSDESVEMANCLIQSLLEVVTARDIEINEELTVNYNRA